MDEARETAEAVAVSRGTGEPPAADAARISVRSASRRGALRMDAAPAENWSDATNPASSTSNAVWTAAERQQFAARGGVASQEEQPAASRPRKPAEGNASWTCQRAECNQPKAISTG